MRPIHASNYQTLSTQNTRLPAADSGVSVNRRGDGGSGGKSALFVGAPYTEGVNDSNVTVAVRNAKVGATYLLTITSSGGGTPVTSTASVSTIDFNITGLNLTGLSPGALSLTYAEDAVVVATNNALLLPPFDVRVTQASDRRITQSGDVRVLA
jgi:hypothetical protein